MNANATYLQVIETGDKGDHVILFADHIRKFSFTKWDRSSHERSRILAPVTMSQTVKVTVYKTDPTYMKVYPVSPHLGVGEAYWEVRSHAISQGQKAIQGRIILASREFFFCDSKPLGSERTLQELRRNQLEKLLRVVQHQCMLSSLEQHSSMKENTCRLRCRATWATRGRGVEI